MYRITKNFHDDLFSYVVSVAIMVYNNMYMYTCSLVTKLVQS